MLVADCGRRSLIAAVCDCLSLLVVSCMWMDLSMIICHVTNADGESHGWKMRLILVFILVGCASGTPILMVLFILQFIGIHCLFIGKPLFGSVVNATQFKGWIIFDRTKIVIANRVSLVSSCVAR